MATVLSFVCTLFQVDKRGNIIPSSALDVSSIHEAIEAKESDSELMCFVEAEASTAVALKKHLNGLPEGKRWDLYATKRPNRYTLGRMKGDGRKPTTLATFVVE